MTMGADKAYHEMTASEYLLTDDSKRISKASIAALKPEGYTAGRLNQFPIGDLKILAYLWGVAQNGPKPVLIARIVRRKLFREALAAESVESLGGLRRRQLAQMAKEAGFFYSALNKAEIAAQLIAWRRAEGLRASQQLGEARHFQHVQRALFRGLKVPDANRDRYGLDVDGAFEPQIFGVPRSVAKRRAPEAVTAACSLPESEFVDWWKMHDSKVNEIFLINPGVSLCEPSLFWRVVRDAFAPALQPTLFG